jgi:hypothetical protein
LKEANMDEYETEAEAGCTAALRVCRKIDDPEYQAGAIDGIITRRLRNERVTPDSAFAMRLRREAHELGIGVSVLS